MATREDEKKRKLKKLVQTYVDDRLEQEEAFIRQKKHLEEQYRDKSIDEYQFQRLKETLEFSFGKKREKARNLLEATL